MLILGILYLFLFCFFLLIRVTTGIPAPEDPDMWPVDRDKLAKPALELPDFARTKDKDQSLRTELAALLETRGELERAFMLGAFYATPRFPSASFPAARRSSAMWGKPASAGAALPAGKTTPAPPPWRPPSAVSVRRNFPPVKRTPGKKLSSRYRMRARGSSSLA